MRTSTELSEARKIEIIEELYKLYVPQQQVVPRQTPPPVTSDVPKEVKLNWGNTEIDWGLLTKYFIISNPQVGKQEWRGPLGEIYEFDALSFIVEAKTTFMHLIFFVHFYDSEGIEIATGQVGFDPNPLLNWEPGRRSRASISLPSNMSKVRVIKFSQL